MPTTYAAYYNLSMADKTARAAESRGASQETTHTTSSSQKVKGGFKKLVDQLRATDTTQTPSGIYTPIIKQGPLFQGLKPAEKSQTPSPIYQRERPLFSRNSKRGSQSSVSVGSVNSAEELKA